MSLGKTPPERIPSEPPPEESDGQSPHARSLKKFGHFGAVGVEMAVFLVLGVKAGQWLDARYDTKYWVLVGLALGITAGFRGLFRLARGPSSRTTPEEVKTSSGKEVRREDEPPLPPP